MEIVLTFHSTHHAIQAEQLLIAEGISVSVMPLPSSIRAGCGLCLRIRPDDLKQAEERLRNAALPTDGRYTRTVHNGSSSYHILEQEDGNEAD